jgi:hypothetical protein
LADTLQCKTCGQQIKLEDTAETPEQRQQLQQLAKLRRRQTKLEQELAENLLGQRALKQQLGLDDD